MIKIQKIKIFIYTIIFSVLPGVIFALDTGKDFKTIVADTIKSIYQPLANMIFIGAFMFFFWGVVSVIFAQGDGSKIEEGKKKIFWGIITLFIMFSFLGIIKVLDKTFDLNPNQINTYPTFFHKTS